MEIRPVAAELFHEDRKDRYGKADSRFSQFYAKSPKSDNLFVVLLWCRLRVTQKFQGALRYSCNRLVAPDVCVKQINYSFWNTPM